MNKQLHRFLAFAILISLIIPACGNTAPVATEDFETILGTVTATPMSVTSTPEIATTQVTIDGDVGDWSQYQTLAPDDPSNVPDGAVDIVNVKAFNNDQFLYIAITQQDPELLGKYAVVVRTDPDDHPDFYVGFQPGRTGAEFALFDDQNIVSVAGVSYAQGEIVEVKIPLELFNGKPGLYIHVQSEFTGGADGFDVRPQLTDELEPANAVAVGNLTTSGIVGADETWSGEVHLTGDITLAGGVTLTIEPGTTVYLASNSDDQHAGLETTDEYIGGHNDPVGTEEWDKNAILIDGRGGIIMAVGTEQMPIVFRPEGDSTSTAQWMGIFIERGKIVHSKVFYAGRTAIQPLGFLGEQIEIAYNEVRFFHWAGIDSHTQNVWIHHNVVEGGGHQAISAASGNVVEYNYMTHCQNAMFIAGVDVVVRNNIVVDCARGLQVSGNIPAGSQIAIVNNTILQLEGPPDGWYYQGTLIYPAFEDGGGLDVFQPNLQVTIENNIVYGPFAWGIGLHSPVGAGSVIDYNLIFGTTETYIGAGTDAIGGHNIFSDPLLTGDYQLLPRSAAIDAGAPDTFDDDGSAADLGAYGGEFAYGW